MATEHFYNLGTSSLAAGATAYWWVWFGTGPTIATIATIPESNDARLRITPPRVQRNGDGTVTYFVDVTNEASFMANYHLAIGLVIR
jgi:hypothetical protein